MSKQGNMATATESGENGSQGKEATKRNQIETLLVCIPEQWKLATINTMTSVKVAVRVRPLNQRWVLTHFFAKVSRLRRCIFGSRFLCFDFTIKHWHIYLAYRDVNTPARRVNWCHCLLSVWSNLHNRPTTNVKSIILICGHSCARSPITQTVTSMCVIDLSAAADSTSQAVVIECDSDRVCNQIVLLLYTARYSAAGFSGHHVAQFLQLVFIQSNTISVSFFFWIK